MKYLGKIQDNKDLVTKEYVDNRSGVTGVKGNSESSYRTGYVNLTAANVGAIQTNTNGNTQNLYRPSYLRGATDNTLDAKINTLRANRLAFLPADQIIIEKTTDGGATWVDAGVADSTKVGLFSETRAGVSIPLLNGVKSLLCGLRITITAMKYNVPSGTAETAKYNYWNSNYVVSTERYNQLKEMYFWVSVNSDTMGVKVERATGANSTNWVTAFDDSSFLMTGFSGNDYLRFSQNVFGGGTTQTTNYWNYRFTFMTKGTTASNGATLATTYTTSAQSIMEIRAYGDTWWTAGNEYAANDKIYTHDYLKNVTFPNNVTATGGFTGNVTGTATNASKVNNHTVNKDVPSDAVFTDTTYESKTAASGGTAVSLCTTGEKYTWNNKSSLALGETSSTAYRGDRGKTAYDHSQSAHLALGETSSTAYRGDRGKTAYDHSQSTHARTDATAVAASTTNGKIKINGTDTTVYTHPTTTAANAAAVKVGKDASGHVVLGNALTASDVSAVPTSRTINGQGLSSDVTLTASNFDSVGIAPSPHGDPVTLEDDLNTLADEVAGKQETLVSGTNIKTVNSTSLLGSGDIAIAGLPSVTSSDNGKVLRVVSGAWAAASLPSASGVSF